MSTSLREQLIAVLRERSVRFGTFTLASGKTSDFYVDVRNTALHADGARLVGLLVLDALSDEVEAVGGLTLGADPVACSAAALSTTVGRRVNAFLIRKEPKGHGRGGFLAGGELVPPGTRVCIVEDTSTTGGSMAKAIERAREAGLEVVQALTVVDRQEGAAEHIASLGLTLEALVTRADLEDR